MRKAAGILMILLGIVSASTPLMIAQSLGLTIEEIFVARWIGYSGLFLLSLIVGGGICAFIKKAWWWALSGAICSVLVGITYIIFLPLSLPTPPPHYSYPATSVVGSALLGVLFTLMGILAIIFLIMRRGEFE